MKDCTFLIASLLLNSYSSYSLLRLGWVRLSNQFKKIDLEAEYLMDLAFLMGSLLLNSFSYSLLRLGYVR